MVTAARAESRRKSKGAAWKMACLFLTYVGIAAACNVTWHLAHLPPQMHNGVIDPQLMLIAGALLVGAILAATALTLQLFEKRALSTVGIPLSGPWAAQLLIGLLVGLMTPLVFFLIAWKSGHANIASLPIDTHQALTETLPAFGTFSLLAFHEELVFRGYLLQVSAERWGKHAAALATGVLFGLVHITNEGVNILGMAFTAFGGVLLAWVVMRSGSLWLAAGYHAAWNATAALALGLGVSGTSMAGAWIRTTITGPRWFSGGLYGFEASWITGLAEPIILGSLVWLAPRLPSHPQLRRFFEKPIATANEIQAEKSKDSLLCPRPRLP